MVGFKATYGMCWDRETEGSGENGFRHVQVFEDLAHVDIG